MNSKASIVDHDNTQDGGTQPDDGLQVFGQTAGHNLSQYGIAAVSIIHPDFLSQRGSVAVNLDGACAAWESEVVPRKSNRMIVVGPKQPYVQRTSSPVEVEKADANFEAMVSVSFVVVLSDG